MNITINLLVVIILLISTLIYTYKNDVGMFLFILLLMSIFLYMDEYFSIKINNLIVKPVEKLENIYNNIINKLNID